MIDSRRELRSGRSFWGEFYTLASCELGDTHIHMGLIDYVRGLSGAGFRIRLPLKM